MAGWRRAQALPERADAARDRRPARLRPCLGRGASFPRGIFAFAVAGILPGGREPAHQARSGSATASSSSPPTIRPASPSASRCSTSSRNGRCEFGMGESASITELTPFGRDMETKREVFEEAVQAIFPMFTKVGTEHHGKYFDIPLAQCRAEAGAEAASAVVDGVLAIADHRTRRPERFWRARLPVRQRGRRACLGARLLQRDHQAAEEARRLRDQPEHGAGVVLHVRQDRRGGPRARRRRHLLPVRVALLRRLAEPAASGARHRQHVGRVQQVEARRIRRRRRPRCAAA